LYQAPRRIQERALAPPKNILAPRGPPRRMARGHHHAGAFDLWRRRKGNDGGSTLPYARFLTVAFRIGQGLADGLSSIAGPAAPLACACPGAHNSFMAIIAHGVDIVEVARIARLQADHGRHFLDRCFTPAEQAYCLTHKYAAVHLAGRFAAKEAVVKVLGTGVRGDIGWTDVEVLNDSEGQPHLRLAGGSAARAAALGIIHWHISISHTNHHAIASAIGES
jgi:holo-[acyl-carrier protein] synthase